MRLYLTYGCLALFHLTRNNSSTSMSGWALNSGFWTPGSTVGEYERELEYRNNTFKIPFFQRKLTTCTVAGIGSGPRHLYIWSQDPISWPKYSSCSGTFSKAQDFHDHLDNCILSIVEQESSSGVRRYEQTSADEWSALRLLWMQSTAVFSLAPRLFEMLIGLLSLVGL
jgi:hypothetical protein